MRKLSWMGLLAFVLAFAMPAMAQNSYSPLQGYAGYGLLHATCCGGSVNANGGVGEVEFNASNLLGIVGEFAGYTTSQDMATLNIYTYQGGPRIYLSRGKIEPWFQFLIGGAHLSGSASVSEEDTVVGVTGFGVVHPQATSGGLGSVSGSANGFNMDIGGGVDVNVAQHFAIRPVELSYEYSHFSAGSGVSFNSLRYSAGFVIKF